MVFGDTDESAIVEVYAADSDWSLTQQWLITQGSIAIHLTDGIK